MSLAVKVFCFIVLFCCFVFLHEATHWEINVQHGCSDQKVTFFRGGLVSVVATCPVGDSFLRLAHDITDIVGYLFIPFLCLAGAYYVGGDSCGCV